MKASTLFLFLLAFSPAIANAGFQKRWLNGVNGTNPAPDTTSDCTYWANNITAEDTCSELESYFDITFTQLKAWNPSLLQSYCALVEGFSYCVEGPDVPANASTATSVDAANATSAPHSSFTDDDGGANSTNDTATSTATSTVTSTATSSGVQSSSVASVSASASSHLFVLSGFTSSFVLLSALVWGFLLLG
ncbi:hypothetical protein BO94DRAFT_625419 [Aspergillus sclerotioniger CBS 115572]|uniref:LysM domain-containing protein n=1 Tax=Aspergillus sclerotioniger CBS 115572 TaxID=1450535 RepID=A0A317WD62_9EURO|nr:hypothetical protein BO94DRAFT_625419 [Aspergillus sclerotioniger CBS 115572]PWY83865.1 hypothetical protein BO94DRAFT_625419 [Aspergillus sclerotioniger CBS 115572]